MDRLAWVNEATGRDYLETFIAAAWFIWGFRNQFLFGNSCLWQGDLWSRASDFLASFSACGDSSFSASVLVSDAGVAKVWKAPYSGSLKMNVDAALEKNGVRFGASVVVRDDSGVVRAAAAFVFNGFPSVETAETKSIWSGLSLAVDKVGPFPPLSLILSMWLGFAKVISAL
ncbi:hypothetical protein ACOSP7_018902 [Xanthoceras sorbifolium]